MGGRSPPVRNKTELNEMVGMLENLRVFPSFPENLFLSVTSGEVNIPPFEEMTLEHWPKDIRDAKNQSWRDYYTGEKLENYNETWGKENVVKKHCARVIVGESDEFLTWSGFNCSQIVSGSKFLCPCLQQKRLLLSPVRYAKF